MQLTRKTSPWKYLLFAVAAVMVVGFAVVPRPIPPTTYRRYISPPLADGVRYTFLYPATLDDVYSTPVWTPTKYKILHLVTVSKQESRLPGAALWHTWFKPEAEFVNVVVEKPTAKPLKISRSETQNRNRVEIIHTVLVDDPRAREHFRFWHASDFGTASFNQHDRVVMNSFRILRPGEPIPAP